MARLFSRVFCTLTILLIFLSCVKEVEQQPGESTLGELHEVVFHAGWAPETKTVLQEDGCIWWEPGDEISLFVNSGENGGYKLVSTNTMPASTVDFEGQAGAIPDNATYIAVYPYDEATFCYGANDGISVILPNTQVAKENDFPEKVFKSFAISNNENLYFKNLFGGIKFSVSNPDIRSITIRSIPMQGSGETGPALSGRMKYDASGELVSASGYDQIIVTAPNNGYFSPDKYYYAVLPARELTDGVTITYKKDNTEASIILNDDAGVTFTKSKFKRLYKADENLTFHASPLTYARFTSWDIIPDSINRQEITEMHFYVSTDKATENILYHTDPNAETVYYEIDGTVLNYYTKGEVYQVIEGYGNSLFSRLINLRSLDLSNFDTSMCTDFGGMFLGCLSLKEITFGDRFITGNAKRMYTMFQDCVSLETIDLSHFDTSNVWDMNYMFMRCSSLKNLDLSFFDTHNVKSMGGMFAECYRLEKLDISTFSSDRLEYAQGMFTHCRSLLKLDMGAFDLSLSPSNYLTCYKMASRSRNCAVLCCQTTREIMLSPEAQLQGCADYIQWFSPGETLPDLSMNYNPDLYYSTDYSKDKEVKMLNVASEGRGVNLVIMGEAYSDRLIADGTYEKDMTAAMEQIFSIEPFKSFRHLFNVYMVIAVSENENYDQFTAFNFTYDRWKDGDGGDNDDIALYEYISQAVGQEEIGMYQNKNVTTLIVVNDYNDGVAMIQGGGGTDDEYYDYPAKISGIGWVGKSVDEQRFRYVVCHEFGHAFAALHDEYVELTGEMETWEADFKQYYQSHFGWWANVAFTSDPSLVGWCRFLDDNSGYDESEVSIIEGAFYSSGIWKSVVESMMNSGGEYSVPAREAIYKKIHKVAYGEDWEYSFNDFVTWDRSVISHSPQMLSHASRARYSGFTHPKPVFKMEESVSDDGRRKVTVIMN